ncbi:MAG: amino acid permease [Deltaproteobacteria bacterium]|nr:amino acid permease [Deltaproteobacteria bacterium]
MKRQIGLSGAAALIVGNMIGVGIFTTVGFMAAHIGNPLWMIGLWFGGGLMTMVAAWCYGVLGAAYPEAGGDYVFLREGLGEWAAFVAGWVLVCVILPSSIAALSSALADGLSRVAGVSSWSMEALAVRLSPKWAAAGLIVGVHLVSAAHLRWTLGVQKLTTALLILVVASLLFLGFGWGDGHWGYLAVGGSFPGFQALGVAAVGIIFSYSGFFQVVYLGGEVRDPTRIIPKSILLSVTIVTAVYTALVALYLFSAPIELLAGRIDVGQLAAKRLLGAKGGLFIEAGILLAIAGSLNATVPAGPRIAYAMSADRCFPKPFGVLWSPTGMPMLGLALQAALSLAYLLLGAFDEILSCTTIAMVLSSMGVGISLLRLRRSIARRRHSSEWRIILPATVFVVCYVATGFSIAYGYPEETALGLGIAAAAVPLYVLKKRLLKIPPAHSCG